MANPAPEGWAAAAICADRLSGKAAIISREERKEREEVGWVLGRPCLFAFFAFFA